MASTDTAAHKTRIITHMNRDHAPELSNYLRHYCGLTARAASAPELKDVSLEGMLLTSGGSGGKQFTVPFTPPLTSLGEMRPRVVEMAATSRQALGLSDIQITAFAPPAGFDVVVAGAVAFYFFSYLTVPFIVPGTPIWSLLTVVFPGGPAGYHWIVKTIFLPVLAIHVSEAWWFNRTRMVPHGVEVGSTLWWKWEVSTFFEGIRSFQRIDGIIEAKKKEKAAKTH